MSVVHTAVPTGVPPGGDLARRYLLVELFLVRVLGMTVEEAPAEAAALQHAVSDRLLGRIDALLGRPERDLRGERIPRPQARCP